MSFSNPPKFFKSIQNHELQNGELRVPKKFVQIFWKGIQNPVLLRLPNGNQQEVFWVERNGDIWLQKNWKKLAKFLKYGYILVFKYIGGACFKVKIFAQNTLEINYNNIKFIDEVVSEDENGGETRKEVFEVSDDSDESDDDKRKVNMDYDTTYQNISNSKGHNVMKSNTRVEICVNSYYPYIRSEFFKRHKELINGKLVKLKMGTESWSVKVNYCGRSTCRFYRGWGPFRDDCKLENGDKCFLELIDEKKLEFEVSIERMNAPPQDV